MTAPPDDQGGMSEEEIDALRSLALRLIATIDSLRARVRALEKVAKDANAMILSLQHAKDTSSGNDSGTWFPSAECPVCGSEDIKPHHKDCKLIAVSTALDAALSELDGGK